MVTALFIVAAAGGALIRWELARLNHPGRPVGTLVANLVACLAVGALVGSGADTLTVVGVGHLGSLSTFSTVMREVHESWSADQRVRALGYLTITVVGGVGAAWLGIRVG